MNILYRSTMNTFGKILQPENITYYLYISGGYISYNIGDRVRVFPAIDLSSTSTSLTTTTLLKKQLNKNNSNNNNDEESDYDSDDSNDDLNQVNNDKKEFGKPQKKLYIAKPVEKLPYTGEIISTKRSKSFSYFTILLSYLLLLSFV